MNIEQLSLYRTTLTIIGATALIASTHAASLAIQENDAKVDLTFTGTHTIEFTANFPAGPWTSLGEQSSPFTDPSSDSDPVRFYRFNDGGVFSDNAVAYYRVAACAGFALIANQLNTPGGNTITNIFKIAPNNTQVYKYNPSVGVFTALTFIDGIGWDGNHPDLDLNPGEGIFLYTDGPYSPRFFGEVPTPPSSVSIPPTWSIISCPLPRSGPIDSLGFSPVNGDQVYRWDCNIPVYHYDEYIETLGWSGSSHESPPSVRLGEAFFIFNPDAARTWTSTF